MDTINFDRSEEQPLKKQLKKCLKKELITTVK
jgi:hypothetical protein